MELFLQDVRQAWRMMRRSPGFTLAAVAALAIGIGANTAIFSVVNTVLLKPLPYPDPGRLVVFTSTSPQGEFPFASPTKFNLWRQQTGAFDHIAAFHFNVVNLTGGDPEQIQAGQVSAEFFPLFGAQTIAGRTFTAAEDRPHGGHVAVLSNGFWKRRFGGDPSCSSPARTSLICCSCAPTRASAKSPSVRPSAPAAAASRGSSSPRASSSR